MSELLYPEIINEELSTENLKYETKLKIQDVVKNYDQKIQLGEATETHAYFENAIEQIIQEEIGSGYILNYHIPKRIAERYADKGLYTHVAMTYYR